MILVRPVLIIVCTAFAILMNSCLGHYDNCNPAYSYCEDSTAANFKLSQEASTWWLNDSIPSGMVEFKNESGASLTLSTLKISPGITTKVFDTYKYDRKNECKELLDCNVRIIFTTYGFDYYEPNYNFRISIRIDRSIPTNTSNLDSSLWTEHLVFTSRNKSLKLTPNQHNTNYNTFEKIPTLQLNNKTYTNAIHVYDSSLLKSKTLEIVGYYYTPSDGLIRYYYNNKDVWTIQ
jgi:hypothetical protein